MAEKFFTVRFRDHDLLCMKDGDESLVAMRPVVEGIGLAWQTQHRKIMAASDRWRVTIKVTRVPGQDRAREHLFIPLQRLFGWLMSIHPGNVRPELRAEIVAYQQECDQVLARHFFADLRADSARLTLLQGEFFHRHPRWLIVARGVSLGTPTPEIARQAGYRTVASVYRAKARLLEAGIL